MPDIKNVVAPHDLSDIYFDKGDNTALKIEYKLQYTIAKLRTASNIPDVVFITDSGKQGMFQYDSTDTTSTDDGAITIVNGTKRFKRKFEGKVNITWFGGIGNGSTDNTTAIINGNNYCSSAGKVLYFPNGVYNTSGIDVKSNTKIEGETKTGTIIKLTGTPFDNSLIRIVNKSKLSISNITLDGNNNTSGGQVVFVYNNNTQVSDFSFDNVIFKNKYENIHFIGDVIHTITNVNITNCYFDNADYVNIEFRGVYNLNVLNSTFTNWALIGLNTGQYNFSPSIAFYDVCSNVKIDKCNFYNTSTIEFAIEAPLAPSDHISITNCNFDAGGKVIGGGGISGNFNYANFDNNKHFNGGAGVLYELFGNIGNVTLSNLLIEDGQISIVGGTKYTLNNIISVVSGQLTDNNITIANVSDVIINNCNLTNSTGNNDTYCIYVGYYGSPSFANNIKIKNCQINAASGKTGIRVHGVGYSVNDLSIINNYFTGGNGINLINSTSQNCEISNNDFSRVTTGYTSSFTLGNEFKLLNNTYSINKNSLSIGNNLNILTGNSNPNSNIYAGIGSLYAESTGGLLYIKNTNNTFNTGWNTIPLLSSTQTWTGLNSFQGTTVTDSASLGTELLTGSNWTSTGWTGSFGSGWVHTTGNTSVLSNTLVPSAGQFYQITYTVIGRTTGTFDISFGGVSTTGLSTTGASGILTTSTGTLSITPTSIFDGTIVISIKTIGTSTALITYKNSNGTVVNEKRIVNDGSNIFEGLNSGYRITTGINNTAIGYNSALNLTSGSRNTLFGTNTGTNITTGQQNVLIGNLAGTNITTGVNNSFLGNLAGTTTTTGGSNLFLGNVSGKNNTTGSNNQYIGSASGFSNITGNNNIGIGDFSLNSHTSGSNNMSLGFQSMFYLTSGNNNIALGYFAGRNILGGSTQTTTSNNSLFLGYQAFPLADSQTNQTVIGYNAVGNGSNTTVIGNTSTNQTQLFGTLVLSQTAQPTISSVSILDIQSTTKGILIPRMTTVQRNAITGVNGLQVYDSDLNKIFIHDGTNWGTVGALTGSYSQTGTATTVFTVTIGTTMPNTTYKVNTTPTSMLAAAVFYVTNKTTTTFDVVYLTGITGIVSFDWSVFR